ncbi:hypothetical protein [Poseidonocella sp. HB161398]|uniref:hypothetical protein n=1 Tax=Poseidonocella sp. HB161398 TaxID=2320855 RepID=UPI00110927CC|nr:hypothetical protein [Poseidonocella sp. HB161398]
MTSDRKGAEMHQDDETFDARLAEMLQAPGDADVALLSRSVMTALAEDPAGQGHDPHPARELVFEPLPWAAGLGGLLILAAGLGYALLPQLAGEDILMMFALKDLGALLGGM